MGGTVQGGLIGVEHDGVVGWAWDTARPDQTQTVRLVAAGEVVAVAVANRFDDARVRMLAGPGVPGFVARLAAPPACGLPFLLELRDAGDRALGAPLPIGGAADLASLLGVGRRRNYQGHVDGLQDGMLQGWARDGDDAVEVVEVDVLDRGVVLGSVVANRLREDLRAAGVGHGVYGFSFDLPARLMDGQAHSLEVRVADSGLVLPGGPVDFGPSATSALLKQMSALQSEVALLRMQVDGLIAPDGPVQRGMLRILAERIGAQGEIQREQLEREMAALRAMVFAAAERSARDDDAPEQYGTARREG